MLSIRAYVIMITLQSLVVHFPVNQLINVTLFLAKRTARCGYPDKYFSPRKCLSMCQVGVTAGLGVWQTLRYSWKVELIENRKQKIALEPIDLPTGSQGCVDEGSPCTVVGWLLFLIHNWERSLLHG